MASTTAQAADRPERSRNAKAQARHRAKRKAYIEQLETTVTKLQTALGFTPDQVHALPPPLVKIRDLEQENARLVKENEDLHRALADAGINPVTGVAVGRRASPLSYGERCDRDYKRRKMDGMDDYLVRPLVLFSTRPLIQAKKPTQPHDHLTRPSASASNPAGAPGPLFLPPPTAPPPLVTNSSSNGPGSFVPNTPSGSSSTSSPPFSPATMHASHHSHPHAHSQHSPVGHRPPSIPLPHALPHGHAQHAHGLPHSHPHHQQYAAPTGAYPPSYGHPDGAGARVNVKAEDENYKRKLTTPQNNHNHSPHSHSYAHAHAAHHGHTHTLPPFSHTLQQADVDAAGAGAGGGGWQTPGAGAVYSSDRR
ncbi:BZIP domain-containing protein [Mycena kentingensis (nom. inval.)]|nr:BZIP domain-containing protein [Mycena kentingensis (nom. inval.)]